MAWRRLDRLSFRFSSSVALLILVVQAASFFFVYRYASGRIQDAARQQAALATRLVHLALEDGMLKKDDRLVRTMVEGFAGAQGLQRVMILDRTGVVRFSSDPEIRAQHFEKNSPTCQVCHLQPPEIRSHSAILEIEGGRSLRVVEPIPNRPSCHACHDAGHRINGLVMVDVPLDATLASLRSSISHLALTSGLLGVLLLTGTGLVFRRLLVRRLRRFEMTALAIAEGDLSARMPTDGGDNLARVERQFNGMADALTALLARLRQQQADLERVMNSVDDGMAVLDRGRSVVAANEAFARRFRPGATSPIGRRCCTEGDQGGPGACEDGFCPTLACFSTRSVQTAIKQRTGPDGVRHEEVRASPVLDENQEVTHVVEVWRDITDRRSAEAKLAETQRMVSLGMLASGFSHEVNTPLGSIGMCLDAIRRLCGSPEGLGPTSHRQVSEYLRIAAEQVQRAGGITEQFLRLSRGQALPHAAVDLAACAHAMAALCGRKAQDAGVKLVVLAPDVAPVAVANESAVQQVFLNLMLNAIDACVRGSEVTVSFGTGARGLTALVADQGRGIAPEDLPRLFEPFFSRRPGGTGLGLFVSMNLARGWGGDILAESRPGAGTTFTMIFPHPAGEAREHGTDANPGC